MTKEFLLYWLYAVDRHSLQSPFIFDFHIQFIHKKPNSDFPEIEHLKNELKNDKTQVKLTDFGAGSVINNHKSRSISYIAKTSTSNTAFSILLQEIIKAYQFTNVLELGTSLGLNTLYMAMSNIEKLQIHTIEGSEAIAKIAASNFKKFHAHNIKLHIGNIDDLLAPVIREMPQIDLAYLDANHTYEATVKYFWEIERKIHENSIVFIDDIHWSPEMKKAWETLKNHPSVTQSADIYDAGILFFKNGLQKKHHILQF